MTMTYQVAVCKITVTLLTRQLRVRVERAFHGVLHGTVRTLKRSMIQFKVSRDELLLLQ